MSGADDDEKPADENVVVVDFRPKGAPPDPAAPEKYAVFSRFIEKGKTMVTLDARRPGVAVPPHLEADPQLNLDFSTKFGVADFMWDAKGVRATLSFARRPFFCDLPWSAVYAVFSHVDNERLTWSRSLPQEILDQLPEASVEHLERVRELQVDRLLRATRVQRERELKAPEPEAPPVEEPTDEAPRKGGLRLVKTERDPKG